MGCKSQCSEYWAEQAVRSMLSIGPPMDIYYWAVHEEYRMLMFADAYMMPRLVQYSVDRMFNLAEERPYLLWDIRDMMQLSKIGQELVNDRFCDAVARRIDYFADEPRFAKLVKDHPDTAVQIIKAIASQKCSESSSTDAEPLTRRKNCEQTRELEGWDKLGETWFFFPGVGVKPGENHMRTLFGMPPLPEP